MSQSDAYWFPVIGSCVLLGFYLIFTYLPQQYIEYLLASYFAATGIITLGNLLLKVGQGIIPEHLYMADYYRLFCERKRDGKPHLLSDSLQVVLGVLFDVKITWLHALTGLISVLVTVYYGITKNWIASNLFAEAFSLTAISLIHLDTFNTGMILLAGLFVYDIFWVFGTNVMVSVAKSLNFPIKLLFPRNVIASPNSGFSMLGLGDIVIPGTMIALSLRFDHHLIAQGKLQKGRSPYFHTALVFYVIGLSITMVVMHIFKAAQPALLYLSPAGILSVLLTATVRGELKDVFTFNAEVPTIENEPSSDESDSEEEDPEPIPKTGKTNQRRVKKN